MIGFGRGATNNLTKLSMIRRKKHQTPIKKDFDYRRRTKKCGNNQNEMGH
jgi:hypothetical protein